MADGGGVALQGEIKTAFDKFQTTVNEHNAKADQAIENLSKKFDDAVTKDELKKLDDALADMKKSFNEEFVKLKRAATSQSGDDAGLEIKAARRAVAEAQDHALHRYLQTGDKEIFNELKTQGAKLAAEIKQKHNIELKDLSSVIFDGAGVMVRPEYEDDMIEILNETSPMRNVARVMDITSAGSGKLILPVNKKGATAAWINELGTRTKTLESDIEEKTFSADEIYALVGATHTILEDAAFDVEAFLLDEATEAIMLAENLAFVNGDGVKKPRGFMQAPKVAEASWAWGKIGYKVTGVSGAFGISHPGSSTGPAASANGADALIDLIYAFKRQYRQNLTWAMNRQTLAATRKLKDGDGKYVAREFYSEDRGIVTSILGYKTEEFEDMDDIAANSFSIALGDFERGYLITDRVGIQVRRDEITVPGRVIFHVRRRTGGDVRDYQAIKVLKFGTS